MQIQTLSSFLQIANPSANSTATSVVEPSPFASAGQITPASNAVSTGVTTVGDGVIACGWPAAETNNGLFILPFGAGSATNTFTMKVYAWNRTANPNRNILWIPSLLASFTCTLCTQVGVASTDINASQRFCDTIVLVTGNANVSNEIISPTGNVIASIVLDIKGAQFVEFRFGTGSSATSCNAAVGKL